MNSNNILTLVGFACLLIVQVASYRVDMIPETMKVSEELQTIKFNCASNVALAGCQFRWVERYGDGGPVLDLSQGSASVTDPSILNPELISYSYSGRGLGLGDCGVEMKVTGIKEWMVACRVRAGNGGWSYAWADLYAGQRDPLPNTLTPREAVVLPGGEARFAMKAQGPVHYCHFYPQGLGLLTFNDGAASPNSTGRHRYLGAGLDNGECGLALSNVREKDNGLIWSWVSTGVKTAARFMTLIVVHPPSAPTLSITHTEFGGVKATCEVLGARPVAEITWILGDDVIRQDALEDTLGNPQDAWRWPWMKKSILQTISLDRLSESKVLKCQVSHVTLSRPLEATEAI